MSTRKRNQPRRRPADGQTPPPHQGEGEEEEEQQSGDELQAHPGEKQAQGQGEHEGAGGGRPAENEGGDTSVKDSVQGSSSSKEKGAAGGEGGSVRWQSQLPVQPSAQAKNSARGGVNKFPSIFQLSQRSSVGKTQPNAPRGTSGESGVEMSTENEQEYVRMSAAELKQYAEWKSSQGGAAPATFKEVKRTTFNPASSAVASVPSQQDQQAKVEQAPAAVAERVLISSSSDDEQRASSTRQKKSATGSDDEQRASPSRQKKSATGSDDEHRASPSRQSKSKGTHKQDVKHGQAAGGSDLHRDLSGKITQKPVSSPKPVTPTRKRAVKDYKCPRCGNTSLHHEWMQCREPQGDFPRSHSELQFLKQMTILQRTAATARRMQRKELDEDSDDEGEDLGGDEEDEEDAEEDAEEEDAIDVEEEEDSSAEPSKSSSSDPSYRPSSEGSSISKPGKMSKTDGRLERMEAAITKLTAIVMTTAKPPREPRFEDLETWSSLDHSERASKHADHSEYRAGTAESKSMLTHRPGMEGCPELQRDDLLKLAKFEEFEKKYKEYLDKAADRRRTSHNMVYGFRKFAFELRQYIQTLFQKSRTLRETYSSALPSFDLSEDEFLALPNETFRRLYREICTHQSCLPSQVLQSLETIRFQRGVQGDGNTLPVLVVQASAAFRERLRELPRQTVSQCTQKQLKEAFIRMLLGPDERNLADFPLAQTWEQVISCLLNLEGTSEANTLVQKIRQMGKQSHKEEEPSSKEERTGGAIARNRPRQPQGASSEEPPAGDDSIWKAQLDKLLDEFKPSQQQLNGCLTNHQKVLRILQIRDTKRREQELKDMRASASAKAEGTAASVPKSVASVSSKSRSQLSEDGPVCFYCKEKGHYKRDCPKKEKGTGESSGEDA
jgi:hypothetical protein